MLVPHTAERLQPLRESSTDAKTPVGRYSMVKLGSEKTQSYWAHWRESYRWQKKQRCFCTSSLTALARTPRRSCSRCVRERNELFGQCRASFVTRKHVIRRCPALHGFPTKTNTADSRQSLPEESGLGAVNKTCSEFLVWTVQIEESQTTRQQHIAPKAANFRDAGVLMWRCGCDKRERKCE